jgi:acyl-coenzyme A synthetase/AMP-(fatty) acid ligase
MTNADGLGELVRDSRARLLAVSGEFAGLARKAIVGAPDLAGVIGPDDAGEAPGGLPWHGLGTLLSSVQPDESVYPTTADSPAFLLYTSGTTGSPKGAMHRHGAIQVVCETYGAQVLRIKPEDRCLSAAKAFFAYGLGN